jgi:hypothetical protein
MSQSSNTHKHQPPITSIIKPLTTVNHQSSNITPITHQSSTLTSGATRMMALHLARSAMCCNVCAVAAAHWFVCAAASGRYDNPWDGFATAWRWDGLLCVWVFFVGISHKSDAGCFVQLSVWVTGAVATVLLISIRSKRFARNRSCCGRRN